ncbi:MAG: hypothetical protein EU549_04030 [Promethearchaeota archaeon]|nr:MAG: hypothetical protein EU549_04030 [Candidatus Lokiarchaeota archaeon]
MSVDNIEFEGLEFRINSDVELKSDSEDKIKNEEACCDNPNIIIYRGIYVCNNCGMVKGPTYSTQGPRVFSAEDVKNKRKTEPYYNDTGYRTLISRSKVDIYGYPIKNKVRLKYLKLAKIQKSITNSYERNMMVASPKFGHIYSALGLSRAVIQEADNIYKKVLNEKLTTGRSINQLVAACVYIAVRLLDLPRTIEEVAEASHISVKKVSRNYRLVVRELKINIHPQEIPPFISRFGEELQLPGKYQVEAIELFQLAKENGLIATGDPKSYAAAAIYIVMKQYKEYKVNQKEIADIAYISDVTLRKKIRKIRSVACS